MSGYSKNPMTLEKIRSSLVELEKGNLCTWVVAKGQADFFAYKIREALYIARLFPERFKELALQADRVRIVVTSRDTVEARFQKGMTEALILTGTMTPTSGYEDVGRSVVTMTKQTVSSVKKAWYDQQPSNTPLHFPQAGLTYSELVELHQWAEEFGLLMFEVDGALTIQRKTLDLVQFAWSPRPVEEDILAEEFPFKD